MADRRSCDIYLITPPRIEDIDAFADQLRAVLEAVPIACVQLRLKSSDGGAPPEDEVLRAAAAILPVIETADSLLLINDSAALAKASGAGGVHLGQQDGDVGAVRQLLGADAVIGVTCHASIDLGYRAGEAGADYVAFGAFYPTDTKKAPTRATPEIIAHWCAATVLPCVAIGGISAANCAPLVRAGADFLAVSGAIWQGQDGPAAAARQLRAAIDQALDEDKG